MSNVGSDSHFRDAFLDGAARAFFVTAYADYCEESDSELPCATMGADWCNVAPATPLNAYALAGELWARVEIANATSIYVIAERAHQADCDAGKATDNSDFDVEDFGFALAMQAMGHGVSWFDDHAKFDLKVPHVECSMGSFSDDAYRGE